MSEEHLDLLSFSTRDGVGIGLGDRTGLVTSGFMNGSRNLACEHIRTALGFEHAVESRQAYQALKSLATHKTDRNDARGLAHSPEPASSSLCMS